MKMSAVKAMLSTFLVVVFIILAFTGALLYFGKTGVVWGMSRHAIRRAHLVAAVSICVAVPIHFFVNRRIYLSELRSLSSGDEK